MYDTPVDGPVGENRKDAEACRAVRERPGTSWPLALAAGLIVAATLCAWHNSFEGPFVFDDLPSIVDNPSIRSLWPLTVPLSPPGGGATVQGRPLVNLSLAIDHALWGADVRGFHATNLALHVGVALLLMSLVARTLRLPSMCERYGRVAAPVALSSAVLWVVHPLVTESVTYVVQRAESLVSVFYLATLYAVARATSAAPGRRRTTWMLAAMTACALGMATKEVMVTAPLLALLYDRTFVSGSVRLALRRHGVLHAGLACSWVVLAWLVLGTGGRSGTVGVTAQLTPWTYAMTQAGVVLHYLRLALWPDPLVFDYGMSVTRDPGDALPSMLAIGVLLAATGVALARRPGAGFLAAAFFVVLAPSSSVVPIVTQTAAEHRMYLPLAALIVLAVAAAYGWWSRRPQRGPRFLPAAAVGVVVLSYTSLTLVRNEDYRSARGLWEDTVAKRPENPRAHYNLALILQGQGQAAAAIDQLREAVRLDPDYVEASNNLAVALARAGRADEASPYARRVVALKPDDVEARHNLGLVLVGAGRRAEAISAFREALRLDPARTETRLALADALALEGALPEAVREYRRVLDAEPGRASARYNLATALARAGDGPGAIDQFELALRERPDDAEGQANVARLLFESNRDAEALPHIREALRLNPRAPDAWRVLAERVAARLGGP